MELNYLYETKATAGMAKYSVGLCSAAFSRERSQRISLGPRLPTEEGKLRLYEGPDAANRSPL
ncbi:hypothetical protein TRIP_B200658 [uncultured Desulfatiglans sp.]|uniref:Uncharacterized protein n=1 Tax=Uncultured Desulfatiglans sp. TaxID=1748965 RepID=A0A653A3J6_UNCDX|nr:hypothetical protein TRIP_B200658 [uncultured Desulfatiglans sp.]